MRWLVRNLLWDETDGPMSVGAWLQSRWRLWVALVVSSAMDWIEWVEHHPPEIVLITFLHFVFVLVFIAIVVAAVRWFGRRYISSPR